MLKDVAIVILTKDQPDLLKQCLLSIQKHTMNTSYRVYIGDTGSDVVNMGIMTNMLRTYFNSDNLKLLQLDQYCFSSNNNDIISQHVQEPWVLLCNDDVEFKSNCVDKMLQKIQTMSHPGTVGCQLVFPNGMIQHAGQVAYLDPTGTLVCTHRGYKTNESYSSGRVVGNTAALMMISKEVFNNIGGFDTMFTECWEDIHLNMRLILEGHENHYMHDVIAVHHESASRTQDARATYKLQYDYTYKLKPWFDSLENNKQQWILKYAYTK